MIQKTDKSACGTSYHMIDIKTTLRKLIDTFGEPQSMNNDGSDKTNIDYVLENSDDGKDIDFGFENYIE